MSSLNVNCKVLTERPVMDKDILCRLPQLTKTLAVRLCLLQPSVGILTLDSRC